MAHGKYEKIKPRLCTSKRVLWLSWGLTIILTAVVIYGTFFTERDVTAVQIICGLSWAESGTASGFYYWKAKNEKRLELFERMAEKWVDEHGFEAVSSLASIIFNG